VINIQRLNVSTIEQREGERTKDSINMGCTESLQYGLIILLRLPFFVRGESYGGLNSTLEQFLGESVKLKRIESLRIEIIGYSYKVILSRSAHEL